MGKRVMALSMLAKGSFSRHDWAASMRSKGSRWATFQLPANWACSGEMANGWKPAFVIQYGTFSATEDAWGSFPIRNFVVISQTEAELTKIDLSIFSICCFIPGGNRLSSKSHHKKMCVSIINPTYSHFSSSSSGSGSKKAWVTSPFAIPGVLFEIFFKGANFA